MTELTECCAEENFKVKGDVACPLCGRTGSVMHKGKPLYGEKVCKKCYYGFANRRQLAYVIDAIVVGIASTAVLIPILMGIGFIIELQGMGGTTTGAVILGFAGIVMGILGQLLFAFRDGFSGYSLGKKLMGVRVVEEETGLPIGFGMSFKRNLKLAVYTCIFSILGLLGNFLTLVLYVVVGSKLCKGPRMGDQWAKTKVVWWMYAHKHVFIDSTCCNNCGYDLRVTSRDECPECGEMISEKKRRVIGSVYGKKESIENEA